MLGQYSVIGNGTALSPHVINSNGGTVLISQMWVDWNVGDLAATYKTVQHPVLFLTTGFLQSDPDVLLLFKDFSSFGEQIKIGPNPFYSGIHIYCKQVGITILSIRIMDSKGNLNQYIKGPFSGLAFEKQIEIQKGKDPFYFVQIGYTISNSVSLNKTFKLIQY